MAALNRPVTATYAVNETVRVDTQDNEDHSFCGIMFPIRAKSILPIEQIIIQSVAVRGNLGDISIWISNETTTPNKTSTEALSFKLSQKYWTKVYEKKHRASPRSYQIMDLTKYCDKPVTLLPGQVRLMYIHSTLESDTAIVYDDSPTSMFGGVMNRSRSTSTRYEDDKIAIHSGKAHLSFVPFGQEPIWGWGNAWRDRREFVGQIQYGTIYKLWHPERHSFFGKRYHAGTETLLMLQRRNTLFARLPDECIYYILNMCRWDWFDDTSLDMTTRYRHRKVQQRFVQQQMNTIAATTAATATATANKSSERCCKKNATGGLPMDIDADDTKEQAMEEVEDNEDVDGDDEFDDDDDDDDYEGEDNEEQEGEVNDDDDDDEDDDDDDDDDEDSDGGSAWERAHGYRANTSRFEFYHLSSDEEEEDVDEVENENDETEERTGLHPWFGRYAARQVVIRALGGRIRSGTIR